MAQQLAFSLPAKAALDRRDFLVAGPNAQAVAQIEDWRNWPGRKLILTGPPASGKTHLAHVWATEAGAEILAPTDLARRLGTPVAPGACIAVEDADGITSAETELKLLGLHNLLQECGGWLLVTGQTAPGSWPMTLPDLRSRLQAAGVARLEDPDDMLLSGVLLKLFDDRQLAVDPAIIPMMATRMERSFAAARILVERLDHAALVQGRAVNRSLVREILAESGNQATRSPSL